MTKFFAQDIEIEFPGASGSRSVTFLERLNQVGARRFKLASGFSDHPEITELVLSGSGAETVQNGLKTMKLDHKSLRVTLEPEASQKIGMGPDIEVDFKPLSETEFSKLKLGIQHILNVSASERERHQVGFHGPVLWRFDGD